MKWPLIAWRVIVQIFYVVVTLYVFSALKTSQETLMVALFGLVYAAVRASAIGNLTMFRSLIVGLQSELDEIKAAVIPGLEIDHEHRKEMADDLKRSNSALWYDLAGLSIIALICTINIFLAL